MILHDFSEYFCRSQRTKSIIEIALWTCGATIRHKSSCFDNKNINISSFKSSVNIQHKEGGQDRSVFNNQISSFTLQTSGCRLRGSHFGKTGKCENRRTTLKKRISRKMLWLYGFLQRRSFVYQMNKEFFKKHLYHSQGRR